MKHFRIGLDIDGIVADFGVHFLNYLNIEDKSFPTKWDDDRFINNFHKIENDVEFWMTIPKLIEPSELDFKPVIYVTARPIDNKVTECWLANNGFPQAPVITVGTGGSKVQHLKNTVDLFVDDAVHNFVQLENNGVNCLLMDRSHNQNYEVGNKRIYNINEVMEYVIKFKR